MFFWRIFKCVSNIRTLAFTAITVSYFSCSITRYAMVVVVAAVIVVDFVVVIVLATDNTATTFIYVWKICEWGAGE